MATAAQWSSNPCCSRANSENSQSGPPPEFVRVDFKAFFSNERTFVQWMHISVTLGAIALTLSTLADSADVRTAGALLIAPSLFFAIYGLYNFVRRKSALERGMSEALEDRIGPTLLTIVMMGVVGTNVFLSLRRAWLRLEGVDTPEDTDSFGSLRSSIRGYYDDFD